MSEYMVFPVIFAVFLILIGLVYLPVAVSTVYTTFRCKVLNKHEGYGNLDWCKHCGDNVNDEQDG